MSLFFWWRSPFKENARWNLSIIKLRQAYFAKCLRNIIDCTKRFPFAWWQKSAKKCIHHHGKVNNWLPVRDKYALASCNNTSIFNHKLKIHNALRRRDTSSISSRLFGQFRQELFVPQGAYFQPTRFSRFPSDRNNLRRRSVILSVWTRRHKEYSRRQLLAPQLCPL